MDAKGRFEPWMDGETGAFRLEPGMLVVMPWCSPPTEWGRVVRLYRLEQVGDELVDRLVAVVVGEETARRLVPRSWQERRVQGDSYWRRPE